MEKTHASQEVVCEKVCRWLREIFVHDRGTLWELQLILKGHEIHLYRDIVPSALKSGGPLADLLLRVGLRVEPKPADPSQELGSFRYLLRKTIHTDFRAGVTAKPPADPVPGAPPGPKTATLAAAVLPAPQAPLPVHAAAPASLAAPPAAANVQSPGWQIVEPTEDWCPKEFTPHLDYIADFEYQHNDAREARFPGWRVLAASRRGRSHAHEGKFREDAFRIESGDNFLILCASDGAGSCKYSRIGSETACRQVAGRLHARLTEASGRLAGPDAVEAERLVREAMLRAVIETCHFMRELAAKAGCKPEDLRCTLLLAVLVQSGGQSLLLTSHVGDGFAAGLSHDSKATRYGGSDSGPFSGEVACFVPDPETQSRAKVIRPLKVSQTEALILCTDGIEDPFYNVESRSIGVFRQLYLGVKEKLDDFKLQPSHGPVIDPPAGLATLNQWLGFEKRGENDDRTIVFLFRDPPGVRPVFPAGR